MLPGTDRRGQFRLIFTLLFAVRVAGQLFALTFAPEFLPAFEHRHSGLLPYPLLLSVQLLILLFQVRVLLHLVTGGPSSQPPRGARPWIRRGAWIYCCVMVLRYPSTMVFWPDLRWTGGLIPTVFHLVLASWLLLWSRPSSSNASAPSASPGLAAAPERMSPGALRDPAPPP